MGKETIETNVNIREKKNRFNDRNTEWENVVRILTLGCLEFMQK